MACGVCQGKPIDFQDMRSPGQQSLDPYVAGAMKQGMQQGATPYSGQLSMPPVDPIMQAIQMMYGMQGMNYSGESSGFPAGPQPGMPPSGINPSPFGGMPPGNVPPHRGGPGWDPGDGGNRYDPINNPGMFNYDPRDPTDLRNRGPIPR